jgi:hypothetical protein
MDEFRSQLVAAAKDAARETLSENPDVFTRIEEDLARGNRGWDSEAWISAFREKIDRALPLSTVQRNLLRSAQSVDDCWNNENTFYSEFKEWFLAVDKAFDDWEGRVGQELQVSEPTPEKPKELPAPGTEAEGNLEQPGLGSSQEKTTRCCPVTILGETRICVDGQIVTITRAQMDVLKCLIDAYPNEKRLQELRSMTDKDDPHKRLGRLRESHPSLAAHIQMPGGGWRGGYRIT